MTALAVLLSASEFQLGTYSYIFNSTWNDSHKDILCNGMNDLGYNTNIMKAFNVLNTELYDTMRNNGLNAIVIDGAWDPATGASGFAPLTTACYHKFEAEFVDEDNISSTDATDSRFWYGTRSEFLPNPNQRYGIKQPNQDASNGYVWRCSPVQAPPGGVPPIPGVHSGFAYTNLTY